MDAETRAAIDALVANITQVSANTVRVSVRAEATLALFTQVAADVMGMQPNRTAYVETLRRRTLAKLPAPGSDPTIDQLLVEIERVLGKLETARKLD